MQYLSSLVTLLFCQMKMFVVCGANNMILVIIVLIVTDLEQ